MPPRSEFDKHFSREERRSIASRLHANPTLSVDAFWEWLREEGLAVSRSTAGKEKKGLEEEGRLIRESRDFMDSLTEGLEGEDESRRNRALQELARTVLYDVQMALLDRGRGKVSADEGMKVARGIKELTIAGRNTQAFGEADRRRAAEEALQAVEREIAAAGGGADAPADPLAAVRRVAREVYGIGDA